MLNSSWSCELQKSPNKAKISQHSRQLSGIKFMIKGNSKHFLLTLRREREQASKNYTCWSSETSFGKHNVLKSICPVRFLESIFMHQRATESYCFHINPSLKIRCVLIIYNHWKHKRIQNSYQNCCCSRWCPTAWLPKASNPQTQGYNLVVIKFPTGKPLSFCFEANIFISLSIKT